MKVQLPKVLACPTCKGPLQPAGACKGWDCAPCQQTYPCIAGIPSFLLPRHPCPLSFLPPEDILPEPPEGAFRLHERRHTSSLQRSLQYYGKERFLRAVRRVAKKSLEARNRLLPLSSSGLPDLREKRRAYRHAQPEFIRRIMEPVMKRRFWTDDRCVAMVDIARELQPKLLLDLATGPGGFLFRALPSLPKTHAVGLDVQYESCRLVMGEADYFGLSGRVTMIHGDARLLPFAAGVFDGISAWTAAYHISRYEDALRECARVLKRGGLFFGTFHTEYPLHSQGLLSPAEEREFIRCARLPLNIAEVGRALKRSGFSILQKRPIGNSHLIVAAVDSA